MRSRSAPPTVADLYVSPELGVLGVLAVLEAAVDVALVALVAAHPDDGPDAEHVTIERRAARGLVDAAHEVATALDRSRLALARARELDREELLPF